MVLRQIATMRVYTYCILFYTRVLKLSLHMWSDAMCVFCIFYDTHRLFKLWMICTICINVLDRPILLSLPVPIPLIRNW